MKYEYIFFDLDGTLTDPAEGIINSFKNAYKYFGMEIPSYEKLCSFIGPPLIQTFKTDFGFDENKAREGVKAYRSYFSTKGLFENRVYDGIPQLLETIKKAGLKLAVATSKPEPYSISIMEHFNLAPYFEKVCGSLLDETRSKKAEVIAYAIEALGITDKSKILMVGDRKHDVLGAAEHGIDCAGVLFGYGSREELEEAGAKYIAADLAELEKILLQ